MLYIDSLFLDVELLFCQLYRDYRGTLVDIVYPVSIERMWRQISG